MRPISNAARRHAVIAQYRAGLLRRWVAIARLVDLGMISEKAEACLWEVI